MQADAGGRPAGPAGPAGFIMQIANNGTCDHFRKERRRAGERSAERYLIGPTACVWRGRRRTPLPGKTRQIFLLNRRQNPAAAPRSST